MLWVGRLFEERYTAFRLAVVALSGVGYLVLAPDGHTLSTVDRSLAVGIIALSFIGIWSPFASVVIISVAMVVGYLFGGDNDMVPAVGLAWSMFELGARRFGWQIWWGLAIGLTGSMLNDYDEVVKVALTVLYAAAAGVAAPLLFGLHVRTLGVLHRRTVEQASNDLDRVRAEERTTIARELHDLVAHHVASIVLRVAVARSVLPLEDPRVRQVLDDVHATGSSALADLRRLVAVLRDPGSAQPTSFVDPEGLPVALRTAVDRSHQIGLDVRADIDPEVVRLDARTALALLRLTQEGLANVAKHAGTAARARLSIRLRDNHVEFELVDSGRLPRPAGPATNTGSTTNTGPAANAASATNAGPAARAEPAEPRRREAGPAVEPQSEGHGLVGLRERMEVLGGKLQAGPAEGGWRLAATIPTATVPSEIGSDAKVPTAEVPA